jgi:hypothetical protein
MLVVMNANATEAEIAGVVRVIEALGLRAHTMPGATRTAIGITGNKARSVCSISKICPAWPRPFA